MGPALLRGIRNPELAASIGGLLSIRYGHTVTLAPLDPVWALWGLHFIKPARSAAGRVPAYGTVQGMYNCTLRHCSPSPVEPSFNLIPYFAVPRWGPAIKTA